MSEALPSHPEEDKRDVTGEEVTGAEATSSESIPTPAEPAATLTPEETTPVAAPVEEAPVVAPIDTPVDAPADAAVEEAPVVAPIDTPADTPVDAPADAAVDAAVAAPVDAPTEASTEAPAEAAAATSETADVATSEETTDEAKKPKAKAKPKSKPKKKERRGPPKPQRIPLTLEQRMAAREKARQRLLASASRDEDKAKAALELIESGRSIVFAGRFRRRVTGGMDERQLRALRERWEETVHEEERRIELQELLRSHGALDEKTQHRIDRANSIPAMEDIAAPHLPVVAGRATVARSLGLEGLAQAIRSAEAGSVLSEMAAPFVKEGDDAEPTGLDGALAGARDILAEEVTLDADLRARLRKVFRKEAVLSTTLRSERKGDPGPHKALVGYHAPASQVPPVKFLQIRRAEKDRVVVATIEPHEEATLPILHKAACADDHAHAGFIRAAAEDGYRRILKPLFQSEIRNELKRKADAAAVETFERNLRHRLLGPVGGRRTVLGLRPDVMNGHRWCAVDPGGLPTGSGTLPHEGTAGREACLAELKDVLKTYQCDALAVGSGGGRAEALALAKEAAGEGMDVAVVPDGGTHVLESQGPLEIRERPLVPAECRGACSLGRRFQDPLAELVTIDPKALALGPHLHEVHQGQLRRLLDETVSSCVAYAGVDPNAASVDLLARVPGFDRASATSFNLWRSEHGPLLHKAALAAVPGVGTAVAEQAVGFLKLPEAPDPRDHVQLHPEEYEIAEKMAAQVGADVQALFTDAALRSKVRLSELEGDDLPVPLLRYVLFQITAGADDPRSEYANPIAPPEGLTLDTLQPGLILEGRVVRAMPFGVFVDVGMGTDALIPNAHIGDHPGIDVPSVAPVGGVVQARVLEVIPQKRRLTLSMRREHPGERRGGGGGGPRGGGRGGYRGGGGGDRRPREAAGAPSSPSPQSGEGSRPDARGERGDRGRRDARGDGPRATGRPQAKRRRGPPKSGKFGGGGISDIFDRRSRGRGEDRGTPRSISLGPDDAHPEDKKPANEQLTEEQILAKKLEDLKKKFGG